MYQVWLDLYNSTNACFRHCDTHSLHNRQRLKWPLWVTKVVCIEQLVVGIKHQGLTTGHTRVWGRSYIRMRVNVIQLGILTDLKVTIYMNTSCELWFSNIWPAPGEISGNSYFQEIGRKGWHVINTTGEKQILPWTYVTFNVGCLKLNISLNITICH